MLLRFLTNIDIYSYMHSTPSLSPPLSPLSLPSLFSLSLPLSLPICLYLSPSRSFSRINTKMYQISNLYFDTPAFLEFVLNIFHSTEKILGAAAQIAT